MSPCRNLVCFRIHEAGVPLGIEVKSCTGTTRSAGSWVRLFRLQMRLTPLLPSSKLPILVWVAQGHQIRSISKVYRRFGELRQVVLSGTSKVFDYPSQGAEELTARHFHLQGFLVTDVSFVTILETIRFDLKSV